MKIYDYIMKRLDEKKVTQREVADGSGVPYKTLTKIAQRYIKAPSVHHAQAIHDYFRRLEYNKARREKRGSAK